jgi:hypothetical protein
LQRIFFLMIINLQKIHFDVKQPKMAEKLVSIDPLMMAIKKRRIYLSDKMHSKRVMTQKRSSNTK